MSAPIKTPYDRTILTMAAEGATTKEIAKAIGGKPLSFIYDRASALGVSRTLVANLYAQRAARRAARLRSAHKLHGFQGSRLAASLIPPARTDHTASDLARMLRAAGRRVPSFVPVPAGVIAHAFDAGLTLDDIGAAYGIPPAEAAAAIRQHARERRA